MLPDFFNNPLAFLLSMAALVAAITVHEFAHAFVADRLGDPTPGLQGRLSLNPMRHLDPMGTLMLLFFRFGWGKPVQFDPFNLRHPRRDGALISLAGPVSNLIVAVLASIVLHLPLFAATDIVVFWFVSVFLQFLIMVNVSLAVFNLIPIHPLDGFKIVGGILPEEYAKQWYELESYGMIFLILLLLPLSSTGSPIHSLISPPITFILSILLSPGGFI